MALELFKPIRGRGRMSLPPFVRYERKHSKLYLSNETARIYGITKGSLVNIYVDAEKRTIAFDFNAMDGQYRIISKKVIYLSNLFIHYGWNAEMYDGKRLSLHEPNDEIGMPYIVLAPEGK